MKKIILNLIILLAVSQLLHAQSFELSVGANAGSYAYEGPGTTPNAVIDAGYNPSANAVENTYGNKRTFSYGAFLQPQYVFKSNFIIGLQGSYDVLRSTDKVSAVYPYTDYYTGNYYGAVVAGQPSSGNATLQTQSIALNPYIGYRIKAGNIKLDIMPGMGINFDLNAQEKGGAKFDMTDPGVESNYPVNYKIKKLPTDVQLKLGLGTEWRRWSLTASYAYGLTNLNKIEPAENEIFFNVNTSNNGSYTNYINDGKVHSSLFNLGVGYRLFASAGK